VALEIMPDHVHLFLNCPPTLAPNEFMHQIKHGLKSRDMRLKHPHFQRMDSFWTRSYFVPLQEHFIGDCPQVHPKSEDKTAIHPTVKTVGFLAILCKQGPNSLSATRRRSTH
jgi:hypothetical protein